MLHVRALMRYVSGRGMGRKLAHAAGISLPKRKKKGAGRIHFALCSFKKSEWKKLCSSIRNELAHLRINHQRWSSSKREMRAERGKFGPASFHKNVGGVKQETIKWNVRKRAALVDRGTFA